jgi:pimeloyl-ACP methyl ester carboxylesterase
MTADDPARTDSIMLEANGYRFSALAAGPVDGELVLCLHGFPQWGDIWTPVLTAVGRAGYRAVAVDQRGYSPGARPDRVEDYATAVLCADVLAFADALESPRFHVVGHDWGAFLGWHLAAHHPTRLRSFVALSTPHNDAFFEAIQQDEEQRRRSRYIEFFQTRDDSVESYFKADDWSFLRRIYQDVLPESRVDTYRDRLAQPGALSATLNWYRAMNTNARIGAVRVPTLYVWGSNDMAISESTAARTATYVDALFTFERLEGKSHWLPDEIPDWIGARLLQHLTSTE